MKAPDFPVVLVLLEGQCAPGLPFLRQLPWIIVSDPVSEESLAMLIDAAAGAGTRPRELWRHSAPYRGLAAMTEADSDFFFGRAHEIVEVIRTLEANPDKLAVLLGNSGVGKSSLAQAGVLAALARQAWPEHAAEARSLAAGLSRQPAVVLSHGPAGRRADQDAGRGVSRDLAIRCARSRPHQAAKRMGGAAAR